MQAFDQLQVVEPAYFTMKNKHPIWTKLNLVENDKSKVLKITSGMKFYDEKSN